MRRPTGVRIIAFLYLALAVLSLLWSALVFGVGGVSSMFGGLLGAERIAAFGTSNAWAGFFGILAGLVQLAIGLGLLTLKKWAWVLALVGVGTTAVQGIIGILGGGPVALMCGLLGLLIPAGILTYLLLPGTRRAFGAG